MKDRFYNGFLSGFFGAITPFVINLGTRALGINTLLWADFMGLFILGRKIEGTLETALFVGVQFVFLGFLGAIFALILPLISSKHYLFKGAIYGTTVWFILFSLPYVLQLPQPTQVPLNTALTHVISASLWGITLAYILKKLDNKVSHQQ